jgi:hypothetical protein
MTTLTNLAASPTFVSEQLTEGLITPREACSKVCDVIARAVFTLDMNACAGEEQTVTLSKDDARAIAQILAAAAEALPEETPEDTHVCHDGLGCVCHSDGDGEYGDSVDNVNG